jgi:endoglucanase
MYAVINLHWDGGWTEHFPTNYDECIKRYKRIWEQVAEYFKDYGDHLLFESQNEELGWGEPHWNPWGGNSGTNLEGKTKIYGIVNNINQTFVDIIRASGGNNAKRHLIIAGYNTNIDRTVDPLYKMPTDPENRLAVKVHYYDPFGFTHTKVGENPSWAPFRDTWGTPADYTQLNNEMNKMKTNFIDKGIPVVIGEYGMAVQGRTQEQINNYTLAVTEAMYSRGMLPMLWCIQLQTNQLNYYYNRRDQKMTDPILEAGLKTIAETRNQ